VNCEVANEATLAEAVGNLWPPVTCEHARSLQTRTCIHCHCCDACQSTAACKCYL